MRLPSTASLALALLAAVLCTALAAGTLQAQSATPAAPPQNAAGGEAADDIDEAKLTPTHEQTAIIKVENEQSQSLPLLTFCLDKHGNILAGVGQDKGEIRVFDADGKYLDTWAVAVKPEAIHATSDGAVYVAGSGKLLKYDGQGKLLLEADAPHAAAMRTNAAGLREQVIAQAKQRAELYARQGELYQQQIDRFQQEIDKLKAKGEDALTEVDQQRIQAYENAIKTYQRSMAAFGSYAQQNPAQEPTEEQIQQQIDNMISSKMRMASISVADGDVYVVTPASVGYGFDVWRTDLQFQNGKRIVGELRGCCGQMDAQACAQGLFVAENARYRVCRYDREGEMTCNWGQGDREGVVGFGSCCNPMNVAFGPDGDVYTAEATLGRIKRFSPSGEFLGLVGSVEVVPGCKKVSIAVNADGSRVYMLDITRNHIVMMQRKAGTAIAATN
jgi:sugar lactone lactonase YvrE